MNLGLHGKAGIGLEECDLAAIGHGDTAEGADTGSEAGGRVEGLGTAARLVYVTIGGDGLKAWVADGGREELPLFQGLDNDALYEFVRLEGRVQGAGGGQKDATERAREGAST